MELTWLLDGRPLAGDRWVTETSDEYVTSRLVIRAARDSDSGTYTCAPTRAAHADVQVHVISGEERGGQRSGRVTCRRSPERPESPPENGDQFESQTQSCGTVAMFSGNRLNSGMVKCHNRGVWSYNGIVLGGSIQTANSASLHNMTPTTA